MLSSLLGVGADGRMDGCMDARTVGDDGYACVSCSVKASTVRFEYGVFAAMVEFSPMGILEGGWVVGRGHSSMRR